MLSLNKEKIKNPLKTFKGKKTDQKSLIDITKKIDSSKKKPIDKKKKDFVTSLNEEVIKDVKKNIF